MMMLHCKASVTESHIQKISTIASPTKEVELFLDERQNFLLFGILLGKNKV
jgi:hypothetical protein